MKFLCLVFLLTISFASEKIFYNYNKKNIFLDETDLNASIYKTSNGVLLSLNNKILVKFISLKNFSKYVKIYKLTKSKKIDKKLYQFSISNKDEVFMIINILTLKDDIKYAEPDFTKKSILR